MAPKGKAKSRSRRQRSTSPSRHGDSLSLVLKPKFQEGVLAAFREWDVENRGYITQPQLKKVLVEVGVEDEQIPKLFSLADTNKDGQIDYEEFVAWLFAIAPNAVPKGGFRRAVEDADLARSSTPPRRPAAERGGHPEMKHMRDSGDDEHFVLVTCKLAAPVCPQLDFTIKVSPNTRISELADRICENHGGSIQDPVICVRRFHPEEIRPYEETLEGCGVSSGQCNVYYDFIAEQGALLGD
eukprot:TRINITY_DN30898_c0_g1_i1.p1 TRINITY_DN30898_c0_g1~~TRINITY_DN30898_c0_g1_i1.p1  ORF type:complete len:241 (-),score=57.07 TRINITY_DN30898_c0_g1_i1:41-763(-)